MLSMALITTCFALPWALAWGSELADVELFYRYSEQIFAGAVPYSDIPIEYSPLATALFLLPRALTGGDPALYAVVFVGLMAACDSWQKWQLWRRLQSHRGAFLALHTAATCLLYYVYLKRFDAVAVLCVTQACLSLEKNPRGLAPWGWLALGAGIKVFPLVLVPIFWRYAQRAGVPALRRALQLGWTGTLLLLPQALLFWAAGPAGNYWLTYNRDRGLHVASSYAAVDLFYYGFGAAWPVWYDYGSLQIHTAWADAQAAWAPRITAALLACTLMAFWRARRETLLWAGSTAMILAMVIGNKAFSPQYAGWIVSTGAMAAVLSSRSPYARGDLPVAAALLLGCGFTALLEPGEYLLGVGNFPTQTFLVLRTASLLALWSILLARGVGARRRETTQGAVAL